MGGGADEEGGLGRTREEGGADERECENVEIRECGVVERERDADGGVRERTWEPLGRTGKARVDGRVEVDEMG